VLSERQTYAVVSAELESERDDAIEHGYVFEREPMSLEEAACELGDCYELSSGPVRSPRDLKGTEWACTEEEQDPATGDYRTESVFLKDIDGGPVSPANLYRLFNLAGLV
jgi:hypothetical protein